MDSQFKDVPLHTSPEPLEDNPKATDSGDDEFVVIETSPKEKMRYIEKELSRLFAKYLAIGVVTYWINPMTEALREAERYGYDPHFLPELVFLGRTLLNVDIPKADCDELLEGESRWVHNAAATLRFLL